MFNSHPTQILVPDPLGMDRASEQVLGLVLRVLAVLGIVFGIRHWSPILGFAVDDGGLIYNLPQPQQFQHVSLAVLHFVTMVGLWLMMAWGVVVWLLIIATEIILHSWFHEVFGTNRLIIVIHTGTVLVYAAALAPALRTRASVHSRPG